jgi:nicotinate-nucleotide adenylyltransferase
MDQRNRIAIYGGTFDPVHRGHVAVARKVCELFVIDKFLFVPARLAPHKLAREVSSSLHRYAMLALATQTDAGLFVSSHELEGPGPQFTVDTLTHFRAERGALDDLFFVMGTDSWAEFTTWREWKRLTTLANLIVVTRPGYPFSPESVPDGDSIIDVRGRTKESVSQTLDEAGNQSGAKALKVFVTDVVMEEVSATEVRRAAREDSAVLEKLVPLEVANYIRKYGLYRNSNEA